MNSQGNKVAISVLAGAVVIAAALYIGLTKNTTTPSTPPASSPSPSQTIQPTITQEETSGIVPNTIIVTSTPEITWTKSDIITSLSAKTGIPEAEVVFSTGDVVDHGNTKLIRGTVQRQGEMSGAGFFAVIDTSGVTVTYAGQGVPDCNEVNPYGYPISWADYCIDTGGNTVPR